MKSWLPTILYATLGLGQLALVLPTSGGRLGVGVVLAVVLLGAAVLFAPTPLPPRASQAQAEAAAATGTVVVYYRAGCVFCQRLAHVLGRLRSRAVWVDIWADADAAEFVRSVNSGDETVPTVVVDGVAMTNPSPLLVRRAVARRR